MSENTTPLLLVASDEEPNSNRLAILEQAAALGAKVIFAHHPEQVRLIEPGKGAAGQDPALSASAAGRALASYDPSLERAPWYRLLYECGQCGCRWCEERDTVTDQSRCLCGVAQKPADTYDLTDGDEPLPEELTLCVTISVVSRAGEEDYSVSLHPTPSAAVDAAIARCRHYFDGDFDLGDQRELWSRVAAGRPFKAAGISVRVVAEPVTEQW